MADIVMIIGYLFGQKKKQELDHDLISCYKINSKKKKSYYKHNNNNKKNGALNHTVNKVLCTESRYFKAGTGKIEPVSQMRPSPLSVNKALLESALAIHPCIMYGCLHTAATGQSGHDSDHKAQNTEKLVVWLFIEKVC